MIRDTLGFRAKIGIVVPSTNTVVGPEMAAMQPIGVTNHLGRMMIPNMPINSNADFSALAAALAENQNAALESVMSCAPDHLILGLSYETFWSEPSEGQAVTDALCDKLGIGVSNASSAMVSCLQDFGLSRIAVLTPYKPIGDAQVRNFFEASGFKVVEVKGLCGNSPSAPAQVTHADMAQTLRDLARCGADAIVQVGTNLPTAQLAQQAIDWLGIPFLAANTVLYREALKQLGLLDDAAFCAEWMPMQR
ncbi:MAG: hypothetical protein RBR82_09155 [Pseudomonas sp.]|nr:hypothetical protein [Pseudomonas sp.]